MRFVNCDEEVDSEGESLQSCAAQIKEPSYDNVEDQFLMAQAELIAKYANRLMQLGALSSKNNLLEGVQKDMTR